VKGPGKWSAPGPALALGGPEYKYKYYLDLKYKYKYYLDLKYKYPSIKYKYEYLVFIARLQVHIKYTSADVSKKCGNGSLHHHHLIFFIQLILRHNYMMT